jgi:hypothetical protein
MMNALSHLDAQVSRRRVVSDLESESGSVVGDGILVGSSEGEEGQDLMMIKERNDVSRQVRTSRRRSS